MKIGPAPSTRVHLATWPTPMEPAPRLAEAIGLHPGDLWIKRDDLSGLGGGGNKVRKLEFTCGAALADGADTLVTSGAAQSNHARLTAAAGARLGLRVVLVLTGQPDEASGDGNLALDGLLGARVVWAGTVDEAGLGVRAAEVVEQLQAEGAKPTLIPFGGSSVLGASGYVEAGHEIHAQAAGLSTVVTALGSGGTMAGLVHALSPERVLGVHCGALPDPATTVAELCAGLAGGQFEAGRLRIRLDHVGDGYSTLTEPVMSALTLAARTEGLVLDPIYTGRALAGLISAVQERRVQPGERTVFLHSGGLPGLFGHQETVRRSYASLASAQADHRMADSSGVAGNVGLQ
jgi:L-cysteate sulfo-lyase